MNRRSVLLVVVAAVCGAAAALVGGRWLDPPASKYRVNSDKWSRELATGTGSVAEQSAIALIATIRLAARVPAASREQWLTQVAGGFASVDPEGTLAWVVQRRGLPHHAVMVEAVAHHAAYRSPELAASLIPEIADPQKAARVAQVTARHWSRRDPRPAAAWLDQLAELSSIKDVRLL